MRRAVVALAAFLGCLVAFVGLGAETAFAQGEAIQGILKNEGNPVQGVRIDVTTPDGQPVGNATTDATGKWVVKVPKGGQYKVTLVTDTLPKGVELRFKERGTLTVQVFENNVRNVLFALGKPAAAAPSEWERAAQLLYEGLNFGLIIALAAVGLSLIFGTTGLTNFAHGELITLGAMLTYYFNQVLGIQLIGAGILAVVASGAFGWLQDRYFWGVLRRRGTGLIAMLVISIGLAIFLRYFFLYRFGGESRSFKDYVAQGGISIGPISATPKSLVGIVIEIIAITAVGVALLRTRLGKATRAVADNPALAASSGIDVDRVIRLVWTIGTALAGLAGVLLGMTQQVNYQMGFQILLLVFAGVTLGGLGTAFGALVGSLVVGMFVQLSTLVIPTELKSVGALGVLILVLLVRPQGILGRRERVG